MQSFHVTRYIRPALVSLFGIGCCILLLMLLKRRRSYLSIDATESRSVRPPQAAPQEERESASTEIARDTALSKKVQAAEPANPGGSIKTISHLTKQRNTLFAVSAILLIASLILGSVLIVQGRRPEVTTQFNPAINPGLLQTAIVSERAFERGAIYPRFTSSAYGSSDTVWRQGIQAMKAQTKAQWIEIPVLFSQATGSATHVELPPNSPNVATFIQGVQKAHTSGYKVFFTPLITVRIPGGWSGDIDLNTLQQQQAWFDSYWNAIKPYIQAAQANKVEQVAVATELQVLQRKAPASLWNQLFTRVASIFTATRTYDMNWSSLALPMPSWLDSPLINMIGVSSYIPLTDVNQPVPTEQIPQLWQQKIRNPLDRLSTQFGKKVLITEIGYRSTSDALYQTWIQTSSAPSDPQLQAQAYNAALLNIFSDPHIGGMFFWGWDNVDQFSIKGLPAAQVLQNWYGSPT